MEPSGLEDAIIEVHSMRIFLDSQQQLTELANKPDIQLVNTSLVAAEQ